MKREMNRLQFGRLCAGLASATLVPVAAWGENMPKADTADAQAQAYHEDASSVDKAAYPLWEPGRQCSGCLLYQGGDAEWGPCGIFPGKQVKSTGWCTAWAQRPE